MGYTTEFEGSVTITPPLNEVEVEFINKFAATRHMKRKEGPYFADGTYGGDYNDPGVEDYNRPDPIHPGLWCQWETDGATIFWDGGEKFYNAAEWMDFLIKHFLAPNAGAKGKPGFEEFTFDHIVNGTIDASGEESGDIWRIVVKDNKVTVTTPTITWD